LLLFGLVFNRGVGVRAEKRRAPRRPAVDADPTDAEERIKAGIAGEQLVAAELGRALGDDWTLLRGYRNRRGEIDHLLLGPRGLFAIEVKNVNATVQIDGDRWRADKYDNYGNLVEQRPITDRTGRSPSEQLNESASELGRFLHERGQRVTVRRVVVLTHRRSRLGATRDLTVQVGTSVGYVLGLVASRPMSSARGSGPRSSVSSGATMTSTRQAAVAVRVADDRLPGDRQSRRSYPRRRRVSACPTVPAGAPGRRGW
jgi:Nuclease-related domain